MKSNGIGGYSREYDYLNEYIITYWHTIDVANTQEILSARVMADTTENARKRFLEIYSSFNDISIDSIQKIQQ